MNINETLNDRQREAVACTEGPLLLLAGAGSGKTRVLTHRIAYLIEEKDVNPWNILAITFTNKAAAEMKERVERTVSRGADSVWVSTFHSTCVRILRRHCGNLGYDTNFSIYDGDDQKTLMRQVFKKLQINTRYFKERDVLSYISSAKDKLWSPGDCEKEAVDYQEKKMAEIYRAYQNELRQNNAMDFDDLIVNGVELFLRCPEILEHYQERFRYIMVDEYQDTNYAQFRLIALLAAKYRNLCVVGDDDQSIYKFRGADVTNILEFESAFPGARVVKLEQNYRSTGNILNAANEVIRNNQGRKEKSLWTENGEGALPKFERFMTGEEEAEYLTDTFARKHREGRSWKDMAVLYRTNAQSRLLEEYCIRQNIPYLLVGGVNFYQRKEIKDVLAYLKTIANGVDDLAVSRIINVPPRGIGQVTIGRLTVFAAENDMNLYDAVQNWNLVPGLGRSGQKIQRFVEQIDELRQVEEASGGDVSQVIQAVLNKIGYEEYLKEEGEVESQTRMENVEELISKAVSYSQSAEEPSLGDFLEQVALVADVDRMDENEDRVTLMTLHSAKGLEFPVVAIAGMDEGLFPTMRAVYSENEEDIEEERRLCYVGITRAREELLLTGARRRMINGNTQFYPVSRFIQEIPEGYLDTSETAQIWPKNAGSEAVGTGGQYDSSDGGRRGTENVFDDWSGDKRRGSVSSFGPGADSYRSPYAINSSDGDFSYRGRTDYGNRDNGGNQTGYENRANGGNRAGYGSQANGGNRAGYGSQANDGNRTGGKGMTDYGNRANMEGIFDRKRDGHNPGFGKVFSVTKAEKLDYQAGDRVRHKLFGEGVVNSIVEGKKDYEVTVCFDKAGIKKMLANFAKLEKIESSEI